MAAATACGFHTAALGGRLPGLLCRHGGQGGPDLRLPPRPHPSPPRGPGRLGRQSAGAGPDRRDGGRPASGGAGRPAGAVEEPAAGILGLRRVARDPPGVAGSRHHAGALLRLAGEPGRVHRLRHRGRTRRRPGERALGDGRLVPGRPRRGRRPRPLLRRPHPLRRAAGEPAARRAQPGGQGRAAGERPAGGAGAVARGGCLRGARRAALGINPFDVAETAETLARALALPGPERTRRAAELRALVERRQASDWLADLLAAARS